MSTGLRPAIPSPIRARSRLARFTAFAGTLTSMLAIALVLTACADGPDRREDDGPARRAAEKAYRPAEHSATVAVEETWIIGGQGIDILLERPNRAGLLPVVLYLPGLGESRHAGDQWRQAWAHAGYAVLSVQPLDADASAWQSDLARNGEFRELGRQHFAASMMARRLRSLQGVVDEGRRRQAAIGWQGLDWNTVVLAGYDLGADAAMAAAGERVGPDALAIGLASPAALRAIVVLSPFAAGSGSSRTAAADTSRELDDRYRGIRAPVLTITSDADGDPLGLLADPAQRLIPFDHLDARPAWLLSMHGMPHAALAGNAAYEITRSNAAQAERDRSTADSQQRQRGNGSGRRGGPNNMGEDGFGPGGSSSRARPVPGSGRDAPGLSRLALQWRVDAIGDVSTAFLDAVVRDDPRAKAWLTGDVSARLANVGSLRSR